jgi:hypothetical protein
MKKILYSLLAIAMVLPSAKADEGMWLPMLIKRLNYTDMQAKGLQLSAEEIYSVNNSSLKDAIVSLGGFCTAEVISKKGLLLTNHHCAYSSIQTHSTVENDYLTDGFWAKSLAEEKPNEGLYARFLVRMEDVTNQIVSQLTADMTEEQRAAKIQELIKGIQDKAVEGTSYKAQVKDFFHGNEFYMFIYNDYTDVRLVGAPPSSVGKYGGDTDNWMWPRHTGDFSLMRVYADEDNNPSNYKESNVPLNPKHSLPISISGINQGDFAMVMGYPGSTDRFLTSFGVKEELDLHQPTVVDIRDVKLEIMRKYMNADPAVRIKYAAKYAQVANYWKYFIGQQKQLKRNKIYEKKKDLESSFLNWIAQNKEREAKYGEALKLIEDNTAIKSKTVVGNTYLLEAGLTGADLILFAFRSERQIKAGLNDASAMEKAKPGLLATSKKHFEDNHNDLEKEIMVEMLKLYKSNVLTEQLPDFFKLIDGKYKGDVKKFVDKLYATSIYASEEKFAAFLEKPSEKALSKDLGSVVANELIKMYFASQGANASSSAQLEKGNRLFVDGLRKMNASKKYYPDANSTMRVTYGTVGDYNARDAVKYDFYTTLEGVIEKMDNSNPEFVVPNKLEELHKAKDYGRYANSKGELVVNFITNTDITGGNSGSPVINAKGELIGCAFDGNWEAMSGDIAFESEVQRTICVDARYILFTIDKYAGAQNLIDELELVTTEMAKEEALLED